MTARPASNPVITHRSVRYLAIAGFGYGVGYVIDVLRGSENEKILARGRELHDGGQYLLATEIVNKLVQSEPDNAEAKDMQPNFENIQAHYDLSDEFFGLFQDPTRKYSCAYFTGPNTTLSEAQIADVDLNLEKLDLKPGMTLLGGKDEGCPRGMELSNILPSVVQPV